MSCEKVNAKSIRFTGQDVDSGSIRIFLIKVKCGCCKGQCSLQDIRSRGWGFVRGGTIIVESIISLLTCFIQAEVCVQGPKTLNAVILVLWLTLVGGTHVLP